MAVPKAYQAAASKAPKKNPLRYSLSYALIRSFCSIWPGFKYRFVFLCISGGVFFCVMRVTQLMYHASPIFSSTIGEGQEKSDLSSTPQPSKIFPFSIGKRAHATSSPQNPINTLPPPGALSIPAKPEFDPLALSSEEEVKLLQKLSMRRNELDDREEKIAKKELLLQVTETQVKEEMKAMKELEISIKNLLKTADKEESGKIMNLVKIYENMKPKEAARIFNQMDTKLLIEVVKLMNQKKISAILGGMNVNKAKELTTLLMAQKNPYAASPKV